MYIKNKYYRVCIKIITFVIIASFLCQNIAWAGNYQLSKPSPNQSKLAAASLLKLIERHKDENDSTSLSQIKLKTLALDEFLRDPGNRDYILRNRKLPEIPDFLRDFFEFIDIVETRDDICTLQVKLDGKVSVLYLFEKDTEKSYLGQTLNIEGEDLEIAVGRGYFLSNFLPKGILFSLFSAGIIPIIYIAIGIKVGSELAFIIDRLMEESE